MRILQKLAAVCFLLGALMACDSKEFPESPYPQLETLEVVNISETGVKLRAKLTSLGEKEITQHGFVWSVNPDSDLEGEPEGVVELGPATRTGTFDTDVSTGLFKGVTYYVKAYVVTPSYILYGDQVSFKSLGSTPPRIDNVEPSIGTWGDTITISGDFFESNPKSNIVKIDDRVAIVVEASRTSISCIVPSGIQTLEVDVMVSVAGNVAMYANKFLLSVPVINDFQPATGTFLDEVTIHGANFGVDPSQHKVTFGTHQAEVISASKTSLVVKVPPKVNLKLNPIKVTYHAQSATSVDQFTMLAPVVTSLSSAEGRSGEMLEVHGINFSPDRLANEVRVGENPAEIIEASGTLLRIKIPQGIYPARNCKVTVAAVEQTSVGVDFKFMDAWVRKGYTPIVTGGVGGFTTNNNGYLLLGKNMYQYHHTTNSWEQRSSFPGASRGTASVFAKDDMGFMGFGYSDSTLYDFWRYMPVADSWQRLGDFPIANWINGWSAGGRVFALESYAHHTEVFEYSFMSDTWSLINGSTLVEYFSGRFYTFNSLWTMEDRLFVIEQSDNAPATGLLFEYDVALNQWKQRGQVDEFGAKGFAINGTGYIVGLHKLHRYNLATNELTLNIDNVGNGFGGLHHVFTVDNKAYFIGYWSGNRHQFWEFDPAYLPE